MGKWCRGNQVRQPIGETGVCRDNAVAESLFSSLKIEFYHHHSFTTRQSARRGVMRYIEGFYNTRRRRHSAPGYWRPDEVHYGYQQPAVAA
jgi:putative transposase